MTAPLSLQRSITPPPTKKASQLVDKKCPTDGEHQDPDPLDSAAPTLAAIEAGEAKIRDHLNYFATHLEAATRPSIPDSPRLSITEWRQLYSNNQRPRGRHFVVHQHDHPVSGVHYDLRLQFSIDSSISFAIPYGLHGNPNSLRPNRMAIETRVHCLWNHLIESASHATGSLLIWDTGEYEVLQASVAKKAPETDDDNSESSDTSVQNRGSEPSDSEKLDQAFRRRHIRLRLHGTRLPKGYTIALRLPSANDTSNDAPKRPSHKRRKRDKPEQNSHAEIATTDEEAEPSIPKETSGAKRKTKKPEPGEIDEVDDALRASGDEEDDIIRINNAYPGANNTIGSKHQRRWFLSLDKQNSGFIQSAETGRWNQTPPTEEGDEGYRGWNAFFVRGREHERSVVTGRLAAEVMEDENVKMYHGRKMWQPIME